MKMWVIRVKSWIDRGKSGFRLLPTAVARLYQFALPIAVVALFLSWFCTVPNYGPRPLPDNWTPGGVQWTSEWLTLPTVGTNRRSVRWQESAHHPDVLLLNTYFTSGASTLEHLNPTTGKLGVASPPFGANESCQWTGSDWALIPRKLTIGSSAITLISPDTLQPATSLILQYESAMDDGAAVMLESVQFDAQSTTSLTENFIGVGRFTPRVGSPSKSLWFQADATGQIMKIRDLKCEACYWTSWRQSAPPVFIGRPFAKGRFNNPTGSLRAVDSVTGTATPVPTNFVLLPREPGMTPLPASMPRGWGPVEAVVRPNRGMPIHVQMVRPLALTQHATYARPGIGDLALQLAPLRRWAWTLRYSEEELRARTLRSQRITGVLLELPDGSLQRVEESLLLPFNAENLVNEPIYQQWQQAAPTVSLQMETIVPLALPMHAVQLDNGSCLIMQRISSHPAIVSSAPSILRLGLLPAGTSQIEWLGWLALPEAPGPSHLLNARLMPRIGRIGEQLVLAFEGYGIDPTQERFVSPGDFRWTTIPLPPQLADLPEGPLP